MAEPKNNSKFLPILLGLMLVVAVIITLVDISIKASILEQANKFRLGIEEARNEQYASGASQNGASNYTPNNGSISSNVLDIQPTRLEKEDGDKRVPFPAERTATPSRRGARAGNIPASTDPSVSH
jgi:hypothetical protein